MRVTLAQTALYCAWASVALAFPTEDDGLYNFLSRRALSPDNTCGNLFNGNNKGYTCNPNAATGGACCSQYGYCGSTSDYCGAGCQSGFGTCGGSESLPIDPNQCGPSNGNNKCLSGLCCSQNGWCGNTTDYCTAGCQSGFGDCTTTIPGGNGAGDGTCGPQFGNKQCPSGQCCSAAGYCGTTAEYCTDPDCQFAFGTCDSSHTPAGPTTLNDPRPLLGQVTYDNDIYDCVQNNVVALTYDDGPYLYTSQLLDILKSYGFKATFFITGNNLHKGPIDETAPYPDLIKRMVAEGHQVASHTWSHYSLSNIPSDVRKQQMVKNERAIANIIGKYPTYMRPPYSQCDQASGCWADMKALGYHRVYFDLDTQDYLNPNTIQNSKDIVKQILGTPGATDYLSIQHDIVQQSVANLTYYYFDLIKNKGWKGVTAGECLNDGPANWYRTPGGSTAAPIPPSTSIKASTTSKTTTTTSKTTSKASTTTPKSSTSSTSKTSTSTKVFVVAAAAPTPTSGPECVVQAGQFCGTVSDFSDKQGCKVSAANCYLQALNCPKEAGKGHRNECNHYTNTCQKLNTYCTKCKDTCSKSGFKM